MPIPAMKSVEPKGIEPLRGVDLQSLPRTPVGPSLFKTRIASMVRVFSCNLLLDGSRPTSLDESNEVIRRDEHFPVDPRQPQPPVAFQLEAFRWA
jgi:hypothetical protein